MTDALQYSMGWAERLAVDSQGRYPASDSVLALAEGLVIRHGVYGAGCGLEAVEEAGWDACMSVHPGVAGQSGAPAWWCSTRCVWCS